MPKLKRKGSSSKCRYVDKNITMLLNWGLSSGGGPIVWVGLDLPTNSSGVSTYTVRKTNLAQIAGLGRPFSCREGILLLEVKVDSLSTAPTFTKMMG